MPHRHYDWPYFMMTIKESSRVLPRPSAIFHAKISMGSSWVTRTLSLCTSVKRGKVSSNSTTVKATKFVGPHKSRMCQYTTQSCSPGPDDRSLIDTGRGYHIEVSNMTSDHSHPSHPVFSTTR
jgi:hypothetical protein